VFGQDVEHARQRQDVRLLKVLIARGCSPDEAVRLMEAWSAHAADAGIQPTDDYVGQGELWVEQTRAAGGPSSA
jgi:hypothetical protein